MHDVDVSRGAMLMQRPTERQVPQYYERHGIPHFQKIKAGRSKQYHHGFSVLFAASAQF